MSFTVLFVLFALLLLVLTFGITLKMKGLKTALLTTAAAFIVTATLFVVIVYAIVSAMPN